MIKNISVVMIAKDADATISSSLDSLKAFDEVVLYLNDSTDKTKEIALGYDNVKIIEGDFIGFGPTKNKASLFAKHDWILSLDSDEILTLDFIDNLRQTKLDLGAVYTIVRVNHYKSTQIKYSWGDDKIVRIYNKNRTSFTDVIIHEKIIEKGLDIKHINGAIKHYPYANISDFIIKTDKYSTLFAKENAGKKSSSPFKALYKSIFHFLKFYIFKRGFLDGYAGLLISISGANGVFYKYLKLYEENKKA